MAGMLYFIPSGSQDVRREGAVSCGLGYAFGDMVTTCEVSAGPGGHAGVLIADDSRFDGAKLGYYKDKQRWRAIPGNESSVHVGCYDGDARPMPHDLRRDKQLDGRWLTLGDGNAWLVPVARAVIEDEDGLPWHCPLPEAVDIDENGEWVTTGVVSQYRKLWEIAQRYWDALTGAMVDEQPDEKAVMRFDFSGSNDAALEALATNYRVGKSEVALLGLFTEQAVRDILGALVDWPTVQAWLEKKTKDQGQAAG